MKETKSDYISSLRKIKVVLGNGSDLQCGLKTKYSDFFKANEGMNTIKTYGNSENIGQFKNFLTEMDSHSVLFSDNDLTKSSVWHLFFLLKSPHYSENRWCDIEKVMLDSFEIKNEFNNKSFWENVYLAFTKAQIFYDANRDKELKCAVFMKRKNYNNKTKEEFYNNLMTELSIFEKQFGFYIKAQMEETTYLHIYDNRVDKFIMRIVGRYDELESKGLKLEDVISIDSFNYSTLKNFSCNTKKFRNINGDIDNPIFGIDSANIDIDDPAYVFTKTSRRLILDINRNNVDKMDDFKNVIIYGHSLNKQDYSYFFPIFDHLKLDDASISTNVIFAYSIYDKNKSKEIKKIQMKSICNIIYSYEKYIHPERDEKRLLDSLSAEGRILSIEI